MKLVMNITTQIKREQPFQTTTELFQGTNVLQDLVGEALPYYNTPLNPKTMEIFNDPLGKESKIQDIRTNIKFQ